VQHSSLRVHRITLLMAAALAIFQMGHDPSRALADQEVTVADGDTLSVIALMWYGDAGYAQTIATYNNLSNPDNLSVGQVLKLPPIANTPLATSGSPVAQGKAAAGSSGGGSGGGAAGPVIQMGLATWYGPGFEGQTTKCGQTFHSTDMTASSNDLPCGTVIDVTNVQNGKSVVVTVDDTGGFSHPQILDLTPAAFSALATPDVGVLEVSVSRVHS
jgi:rare lipoprotein A (peptidoglycan hydrolase)